MTIAQRVWDFILRHIHVQVKYGDTWRTPKHVSISCIKFNYMTNDQFKTKFVPSWHNRLKAKVRSYLPMDDIVCPYELQRGKLE